MPAVGRGTRWAPDPAQLATLPRQAQRRLARVMRGVPALFHDFLGRAWSPPTWRWDWRHIEYLIGYLQQVADGEIDRLLISMPPRHGKTATATLRFPVFMLASDPTLPIILAAYNHTLAAKFSRLARRYARHVGLELSRERKASDDWEVVEGGGIRAAGVGTGVTGHGAGLIVIDDPIKSAKEAESLAYREATWQWFTQDLWTRREPGCAVVTILTRWHDDDLAGRILASEDGPRWTVINLPALAGPEDALGRPEGLPLCPDRYDVDALEAIRVLLGPYAWSAMFQGVPIPKEGSMFPEGSTPVVDAIPAGAKFVRAWDKAGTEGAGKYTAGVKMALHEGVYYVADVVRGRWGAAKRRAVQRETAELDGHNVPITLEQEPGSSGKDSAADDIRALAGYVVGAKPATGEKQVRWRPFAAQWQAGNVRIVRGDWNAAYLDEMHRAERSTYNDQVDASADAFRELSTPGRLHMPWYPGATKRPSVREEDATE